MNRAHKENIAHHPEYISKEIILLNELLRQQREYFDTGGTREIETRIERLKNLRDAIKNNEDRILKALWEDLKKPAFEAYATEVGIVNQEINHTLKKIKKWARGKRVATPLLYSPARSRTVPEPYGVTLIIGPWNYPFQLIMAPLIGAIAAGNTAVIKPSEAAPHTSQVIAEIIESIFSKSFVAVVEGDAAVTSELLTRKFDYIFFTGGSEIGRIIMEAAAKNLTPVTLELGGKSPAIVDKDAPIDQAARKIAWGKYVNAGQTCLAPDYLLAHTEIKDKLVERIKYYIHQFYGKNPRESKDYPRIINAKHFKRISRLLRNGRKLEGGRTDEKQLYIDPTIIGDVNLKHPIMQEEIFGPLLPVLEFDTIDRAIETVRTLPKPLALYIFTGKRKTAQYIINNTSSGGVVVNDTLIHAGNYNLPFGGVGESGIGAYHGKASFDTFSHYRSILKKTRYPDINLRYPPYTKSISLLKKIL